MAQAKGEWNLPRTTFRAASPMGIVKRKSRSGQRDPAEDFDTPAKEAAPVERTEEAAAESAPETPLDQSEATPELDLAEEAEYLPIDPHEAAVEAAGPPEAGEPAPEKTADEADAKRASEEDGPRLAEATLATALTFAPMATEAPTEALPLAAELHTPDLTLPAEPENPSALVAALEERVRRLEATIAQLQNTQPLEERITREVAARLESQVGPRSPNSSDLLLGAGKKLLSAEPGSGTHRAPGRRAWLLADLWVEMRCIMRLLVDPRYRLSWETRLFVPLVILGFVLSWFCLSGLLFVGPLLDKVIGLVLAFILYKILNREARRYRETSPDLPASLRL
jgi:hypothetical protein